MNLPSGLPSGYLVEHLTRRESDILALLGQNLSNREIAERLVLSLHSVKWYARQIYAKLGAANRREAVARARELGLLPKATTVPRLAAKMFVHNLPRQLSSFVGREKEIEQVVKMTREYPLVTLTGAGGVGKTRLAQMAARELVDDFSDGVWYVQLASLVDPLLVERTVADGIGLQQETGLPISEAILLYLYDRQSLLVLDNCEHVGQNCADLVQTLLTHLPRLRVIASSREPLGINGEAIFRVPSLSFPGDQAPQSVDHFLSFESIQLFVVRAQAINPDFQLTPANASSIAQICQRLDGIPLAVELAAARTRMLSVEQIATRLDNAFLLLNGGNRSELPRHQTLKALIDWSFYLLSFEERALLLRLSVFSGGWTLEAAEAVCSDDDHLCLRADGLNRIKLIRTKIVSLLGDLIDKSLIEFEPLSSELPRYRMSESVRQYARERLELEGELEAIRDRNLQYFFHLAKQVDQLDKAQSSWKLTQQRLLADLDNFRLAVKRAETADVNAGLQISIMLYENLPIRYDLECVSYFERLLAVDVDKTKGRENPTRDPDYLMVRGKAFNLLGQSKMFWGMREQAIQAFLKGKQIFKEVGKPARMWLADTILQIGKFYMVPDPEKSLSYLQTSLTAARESQDRRLLPHCYTVLTNVYANLGDLEQARRHGEEGRAISRAFGNISEEMLGISQYAWIEHLLGNSARAIELLHECQSGWLKLEGFHMVAFTLADEAWIAYVQRDEQRVIDLCDQMARLGHETDCSNFMVQEQWLRAWVEWAHGKYDIAAERCKKVIDSYCEEWNQFLIGQVYILGLVALSRGEYDKAEQFFYQIDAMANTALWRRKAFSLYVFGLLAAAQIHGQPELAERAAILFGAQANLYAWLPKALSPAERGDYDRALDEVRTALGEDAFATAWANGQKMSRGEAFAFVLEDVKKKQQKPPPNLSTLRSLLSM